MFRVVVLKRYVYGQIRNKWPVGHLRERIRGVNAKGRSKYLSQLAAKLVVNAKLDAWYIFYLWSIVER